jgi:hypothetical protein
MASSADKLCFDSYDLLARDADVLALAQAQWFSAKDIDPWDPATAREKCSTTAPITTSTTAITPTLYQTIPVPSASSQITLGLSATEPPCTWPPVIL